MQEVFEKIKERLEEKSIEHAINAQQFGEDGWTTHASKEYIISAAYENAIEIVNQVAEEYNNGWIPCSDRLPEARQVILATIFVKSQQRRFVSQIMYSDWWLEGDATIIAWQPMPESYKEEMYQ